jgi:peptide/nickel transport system permease protein
VPAVPAPAMHARAPRWTRHVRRHPAAVVSGGLIAAVFLMAVAAPVLAPYSPTAQDVAHRLERPSAVHLLGTDDFGRDVLSRLIVGSRTTLATAVFSVVLAGMIGVSLGTAAGYFGGRLDAVLMVAVDIMLSFPLVLLALLIVAVLGAGVLNLVLAVGVSQIPLFARLARSLTLTLRSRGYVEAAHSLGAGHARILVRHIVPNMLGPLGVQGTTTMALAIVTTSSLNFLGFGIQPPTPDWGVLLYEARRFLFDRPDILFYPAAAIVATVVALNTLADNLSSILDPTVRRGVR